MLTTALHFNVLVCGYIADTTNYVLQSTSSKIS